MWSGPVFARALLDIEVDIWKSDVLFVFTTGPYAMAVTFGVFFAAMAAVHKQWGVSLDILQLVVEENNSHIVLMDRATLVLRRKLDIFDSFVAVSVERVSSDVYEPSATKTSRRSR